MPIFATTPFTRPPKLSSATIAIVTTAGLHVADDRRFTGQGDESFRIITGRNNRLVSSHFSPNWDRSGLLTDINVAYPIDRLVEMEAEGAIGAVSPVHVSFMGALGETMSAIKLDTGPAAGRVLVDAGVDIVLLTPV